jgi:hypothetical protein
MVEIHTHNLNKELIKICNTRIDDILKMVNNGLYNKIKNLENDLTNDKNTFEGDTLFKEKTPFDKYNNLKNLEDRLYNFIYSNKREQTERYMKLRDH